MQRLIWIHRNRTLGFAAVLVLLWVGSVMTVFAQGTAYLTGYVLNPNQSAVANASVEIKNEVTGVTLSLKTTDDGIYRSPSLDPANYTVTVTAPGFKESITTGIAVQLGQARGLDIHLSLGGTQTRVQVTAGAPLLNTQDAGLGQSVDYKTVKELPYFDRSAGALMELSPGVRYTGEDPISYGASRYNVDGYTNVNVSVDGEASNGDREDVAQMTFNPSVEGLSEFRVIEGQYSAQFGADLGGLVLMQTKSGTNKLHGGGYDYFRNQALDTYNHFSKTRPTDNQQMFGGTLGGPILHNKLFYFTSQEGQKSTTPQAVVLTVPTAAQLSGDFSGLPPIYDPATTVCNSAGCTRQQFPNNQIPTARFDPVAKNVLKYFPAPNHPGNANNLTASTGFSYSRYRSMSKVDWTIGAKDTLTGLWFIDRVTQINNGVAAYNAISPAASPTFGGFGFQYQTQVFGLTETHLFTPKSFMTNHIEWRPRYIERINPAVDPSAKFAETLGIKNYPGAVMPQSLGGDLGFPTFNFTGYTNLGPGMLLFQENPIHEFDYQVTVSMVRGKHSIQAGYQMENGLHAVPDQTTPTGLFNFGPVETSQSSVPNSGNSIASFLLGRVDSASGELGPKLTWSNTYLSPWIQDDVQVNPNLTINMGFRWDIDLPLIEAENRGNSFDPTAINPVSGTPGTYVFLGKNGWPTNFYNTDWTRFAPRLGFAYQLSDRTVIRGGFGMYNIDPVLGANIRAPSAGFTTFANFSSPDSGYNPTFILSNGFPAYPIGGTPSLLNASFGAVPVGQTPTSSPTFVERNWRFGYAENYDLAIERQLSSSMVLEIAGQGSLGRKLPYDQGINEVPPQLWGKTGSNFARRPFPQFNGVDNIKEAEGNIDYNEGYIRFNKTFTHGFNVIANYSIAKGIGFMGGSLYYPQLSRTLTVYNTANGTTGVPIQMATVAWTYALPFGIGSSHWNSGILANLLGGWEWAGILADHSGVPYDISSNSDSLNGNSPLGGRVNLVGNPIPHNRSPANYLNRAAFAQPAFGTIGTYCCSRQFSPFNSMFDSTLGKDYVLHRGYDLKLVAEAFNLFNSPQWGVPDTALTDPGFGIINSPNSGQGSGISNPQDGARIMQLGIRLDF